MKGSNLENFTPQDYDISQSKVIQTDIDAVDGQNKCPKCGATDISLNVNNGHLRCNYCRHEFYLEKVDELEVDINSLEGQIIGSGSQDIISDSNDIMTLKCSSCGAEVVIDTFSSQQARCHWCRNTLSINHQVSNGSVPDVVLPFQISKDVAKAQIEEFVGKRKFFAHPNFKREFTTENIMGVYFPYMIVHVNSHVSLFGKGEKQVRKYIRGDYTYYDADLYQVEREFDLAISGVTVESNSERLNTFSAEKTNNVINAILPFDVENCVKYNANFLKGFTSERRDTNIEQLESIISKKTKDIARFSANDTLKEYDRGVAWEKENVSVKGQLWKATYLPVWLYSYQQITGEKKVLHYVAVNARTKKTMGSVPIYFPKLIGVSIVVEIVGILAMFSINFDYNWVFVFSGIIFFLLMFLRYRNLNARHKYESETKTQMQNLRKVDNFVTRQTNLKTSSMIGANNKSLNGSNEFSQILDATILSNPVASFINDTINKNGGK